jgi:anti-sigma regulatory factor (Ser/Thr protein kinase)
MNPVTTRTGMFVSRQESLREARSFLERFCADAGIARQPCLKLNLVVEELFLNTVKHGHRGGSDAPVWITLESGEGGIRMVYEDSAPPFNPFAPSTREMLKALVHTRPEGGLGVLLAHGFATATDYAYLYGRNRVRLGLAA